MKKIWFILLLFAVVGGLGYATWYSLQDQTQSVPDEFVRQVISSEVETLSTSTNEQTQTITSTTEQQKATTSGRRPELFTPNPDHPISSPLVVSGEVPRQWVFEANIPVKLIDATGVVLAEQGVSAKGDWMETDPVLFETVLRFNQPNTTTGWLVIMNDNASGIEALNDEERFPVHFSSNQMPPTLQKLSVGYKQTITSPLTISGEAAGWFSQGKLRVRLLAADRRELASAELLATDDWFVPDFVPFTGEMIFSSQPTGSQGYLLFKKADTNETWELPVMF